MRKSRAVAFTALVAASALVFAACGNTDQEGTPSNPTAPADGSSEAAGPTAQGSEGSAAGGTESGASPTASGGNSEPAKAPAAEVGGSACGTPHGAYDPPTKPGGSVKVAWNQVPFSFNSQTAHGNATANNNILYLMQSNMFYYNDKLELVNNDQFATCTLESLDPLTVKYTFTKNAKWSDGVPVSAADLLISWAAQSDQFNTQALKADDAGQPLAQSGIAFDSASPAMQLVTQFPEISDEGASLTIKYDEFFVDYPFQLAVVAPAHVVAQKALGIDDPAAATDALVKAFQDFHSKAKPAKDKDDNVVADVKAVDKAAVDNVKKIADFYNAGFDAQQLPTDKSLYLSTGPYELTEFVKEQYLTFKKRADYNAGPIPNVDQITYRIIGDAMAQTRALRNGEVDVINPQSTPDVLGFVNNLKADGVEVATGNGATYEHVDLAQNNGGPFDPKTYGGDKDKALKVRQAFLKTVPREDIVKRLIKPLNPNAVLRQSFNAVPGSPGYDEIAAGNGSKDWTAVDIEGAKKLLAEAGADSPTVRFMYATDNPRRANEYKLISESAALAGFKMVDAKNKEWGSLLQNTKVYDAALFGWQSTAVGASPIAPNYASDGQNNPYGYANKEVDAALKKLNAEPDAAKQNALILEIEKHLWADGFGTVLFQFPEITAFDSSKIQNVKPLALAPAFFWNFWEWTASA